MKQRAAMLVVALILPAVLVAPAAYASDTEISVGVIRTELEKTALGFALDWAKGLDGAVLEGFAEHSAWVFYPDVQIEGGGADSFTGGSLMMTGVMLRFAQTDVGGIQTPRTDYLWAFPVSFGVETDQDFETISGLAEVGVMPWLQGVLPQALKSLRFGLFVQAGYKFEVDEGDIQAVDNDAGGNIDQSLEAVDDMLLRGKFRLDWSYASYNQESEPGMGFALPLALAGWRDLANGEWYYSVQATARIKLRQNLVYDLGYAKGSGAPNFNEGDQFSGRLTVIF